MEINYEQSLTINSFSACHISQAPALVGPLGEVISVLPQHPLKLWMAKELSQKSEFT